MSEPIVLTDAECDALVEHHRFVYLPNTDAARVLFKLMQRIEARQKTAEAN